MASDKKDQLIAAHALFVKLGLAKTASAMVNEAEKTAKKDKTMRAFIEAVKKT
ncbi:hypothetical protein GGF37_006404, partial [Kickxella alabastrina]